MTLEIRVLKSKTNINQSLRIDWLFKKTISLIWSSIYSTINSSDQTLVVLRDSYTFSREWCLSLVLGWCLGWFKAFTWALSPALYIIYLKNGIVNSVRFYDAGCWRWNLQWNWNIKSIDIGQLDSLMEVINHIHMYKHKEDKKVWTLDSKISYTIKSCMLYSGLLLYSSLKP